MLFPKSVMMIMKVMKQVQVLKADFTIEENKEQSRVWPLQIYNNVKR